MIVFVWLDLEACIFRVIEPRWWGKVESCNGFKIEALDLLLLGGCEFCWEWETGNEKYGHVTASIFLAVERHA
jgi:hypothetical protein